ncbi:hypothetical protein [Pseudoalteromonas mariniglutinosa]|uniref:hypothetical protein n=1 Tax=Pseudoalteromonas mariniglutinosa TaxID=206042 RepID=UPI00384FD332
MNDVAVKQSKTLTQYDIANLLNRFAGKHHDYVEIVDVQKNRLTIEKYPLLQDIEASIKSHQQTANFNKVNK